MPSFTYTKKYRAARGNGGLVYVCFNADNSVHSWTLPEADGSPCEPWINAPKDLRAIGQAILSGDYQEVK